MASPLPVLINRASAAAAALGGRLEAAVREAFVATGREIDLDILDGGAGLHDAIRRHSSAPVIAVGGGDGTIGAAANAVVGTRTAIAVLPLGHCNYLARQIGLPLDLPVAAEVAATGERRRMSLGRAGTRVFINNAALGMPDLAGATSGWRAALRILRSAQARNYSLAVDGETQTVRTPMLVVGNNRPLHQPGRRIERDVVLDDDLSLCAAALPSPLHSLWLATKVLFGVPAPESEVAVLSPARSIIIQGSGEVAVAVDGEPHRMSLPLQIATLPAALGVVAPRVKATQKAYLYRIH